MREDSDALPRELGCLDEATIARLVSGALEEAELRSVEAHVARCADCQGIVADAAHGAHAAGGSGALGSNEEDALEHAAPESDAQAMLPRIGERIAKKYRVDGVLGRGGMGVVLAAEHVELGQHVAIKILHARGQAAVARFIREARTCAQLGSEHIPRVFDIGRLPDGAPFIVMERLLGSDLSRLVAGGPLPAAEAVDYVLQACAALREAHAAGVVHRDLKPANLFVTQRGGARGPLKVLDFGISKLLPGSSPAESPTLTLTGSILGSPLYMSPEQIRASRQVDCRTDIWSLGVILYELLTGERPFRGASVSAIAVAIATERPPCPSGLVSSVSEHLDRVVLRCLEKDPDARFASVDALARELCPLGGAAAARAEGTALAVGAARGAHSSGPLLGQRRVVRRAILLALSIGSVGSGMLALRKLAAPAAERSIATETAALSSAVSSAPGPTRASDAELSRRSLAVLGFENLAAIGSEDWLSAALTQLFSAELGGAELRPIAADRVARARRELGLNILDLGSLETVQKVERNLRPDLILFGSFMRTEPALDRKWIKLQVVLKDGHSGATIDSSVEEGDASDLYEITGRAAARLRQRLGLVTAPGEALAAASSSLPAEPRAAQLYAQALVELHALRPIRARELLLTALEIDPSSPLIENTLARAADALGRDEEAKLHAGKALALSDSLPRELRLLVKARYHITRREWPQGIDAYKALFALYPDELDYGIELAHAQMNAGSPADSLATLASLRALPASISDDPRIDYEEARAAHGMSDYPRCLLASRRAIATARARDNWSIVLRTGYFLGLALTNLGQPAEGLLELERARDLAVTYGDSIYLGVLETPIASHYRSRGDLPRARQELMRALEALTEIGNDYFAASTSESLARLDRAEGQFARAHERVVEVIAHYQKEGSWHALSTAYTHLASYEAELGELDRASLHVEQALEASRKIGRRLAEADALSMKADIARRRGLFGPDREYTEQALGIIKQVGNASRLGAIAEANGERALLLGDIATARTEFQQAQTRAHAEDDALGEAQIEKLLIEVALAEGQATEAALEARRLRQRLEGFGARAMASELLGIEMLALVAAGRPAEALALEGEPRGRSAEALGADLALKFRTALATAQCKSQRSNAERALVQILNESEQAGLVARAALAAGTWSKYCAESGPASPPVLVRILQTTLALGFAPVEPVNTSD